MSAPDDIFRLITKAAGPAGALPLTSDMLLNQPSGDLFGLTQNAGMGWKPEELWRKQFLILSTQGGLRAPDGAPIALGYHTGHWEIGELVRAAAEEIRARGGIPFAGYCSDPCDGRTQGTVGMFDSLPYRNDAATLFGRLRDGDRVTIVVDRVKLTGSVDFTGEGGKIFSSDEGARVLATRLPHPNLAPDPNLPADTRLWAALQQASDGTWGGCVYDAERIAYLLKLGADAEAKAP